MPSTVDCKPCCSEPQVTNVPGVQGDAGNDGNDGVNAFTTTTADFTIPAVGSNVTVSVASSQWMVEGQYIVVEGPATFQVYGLPNATSVELTFKGASGDLAAGSTILSGAGVSPAGASGTIANLKVYVTGSVYSLTATPALLNFGTTDPELVITSPGTWLILAQVTYDYNGATFAAVRTVTTKLRRTNNTAADLSTGKADIWVTRIITTETYTARILQLKPLIYTTVNSDDILQLWGSINVVPTAGSLDATDASIVAIKLA